MRKKLVLLLMGLLVLTASAAWDSVRKGKSKTTPGNIVVWGKGEEVTEVELTATELTNGLAQAEGSEQVVNKDGVNGYAGLDENGYIKTNAIPHIIIVYTGGDQT
jgi:hypothetical protein